MREGDELVSRAQRDTGVAPAGERGQPAKRAARQARDAGRGDTRERASPMQALKSAVKKAATNAKRSSKPRR